jgi:hypothetical protein
MKLSLTFLALAVATVQASLQDRWNINTGVADKAGDVYMFNYDTLGNDVVIEDMQAKVYKKDCEGTAYATYTSAGDTTSAEVVSLTVVFTDGTVNDGSAEVGVTLNPGEAAKDLNLWTPVGNEGAGLMEFCVRYSLYSSTTEINYAETIVTLTVTMDGGIAIENLNVSEKDRTTSEQNAAYAVEATLCSGTDTDFRQGSLICVVVDSISNDVEVTAINGFSWTNSIDTQIALPNTDGLTTLDQVNMFSTILYAQFYENGTPVSGTGSANLAFKSRRLGSDNGRALQELGAADAVQDFSIVADLVKSEDGPTALQTAGGATASFVVTIFGLVGAVLLA